MHLSEQQRVAQTSGSSMTARARPRFHLAAGPLAMMVLLGLIGCSGDVRMTDPIRNAGNLFKHPTESGFRAMSRASCGTMSVGNSTVSALMAGDEAFNTMLGALYRGDISNDEFMNQVLEAHPAADANVPATGCIMDQLAQCFAEECKVQTPTEQAAMVQEDTVMAEEISEEVTIDPVDLPSKDQAEADQMIDTSKEEGPKPLP
jgi:hypothetical protein